MARSQNGPPKNLAAALRMCAEKEPVSVELAHFDVGTGFGKQWKVTVRALRSGRGWHFVLPLIVGPEPSDSDIEKHISQQLFSLLGEL